MTGARTNCRWQAVKIMKKSTKKILWIAACLIILIAVMAALSNESQRQTVLPENTRTVKDMLDNSVRLPVPLERVALFGGPTGQIAYILGVQSQLCAVTSALKTSTLIHQMDPRIADLPAPRSTCGNINIESLLASGAQLVIAGDIDGGIVERKTRIPVAYFEDSMDGGFEDTKREIRFYGRIFQREDRAQAYIHYLADVVARIKSRTSRIPPAQRVTVFNGYDTQHLVTLGGDTFMQERIETAGCRNAAKSVSTTGKKTGLHSGLGEVSMEQVLAWDPDILVINTGTPEEILSDPRWQPIAAVKNRMVFQQPSGIFIFDRPTAESAVLYPLWLACTAYPQRFSDVSLHDEVKKFYREVFNFQLTDSQISKILAGEFKSRVTGGFF